MDNTEYNDFCAYCKTRWAQPLTVTLDVYIEWIAEVEAQVKKFERKARKEIAQFKTAFGDDILLE